MWHDRVDRDGYAEGHCYWPGGSRLHFDASKVEPACVRVEKLRAWFHRPNERMPCGSGHRVAPGERRGAGPGWRGVLSHAHNAESIVELREDIGEEGAAVGEPDALSTHAQLLAEKRIGFLLLTLGLVLYLSGIVLKSPEGLAMMGLIAGAVVMAGFVISVVFTRVVGNRIREQARRAMENNDPTRCPSSSTRPSSAERDGERTLWGAVADRCSYAWSSADLTGFSAG